MRHSASKELFAYWDKCRRGRPVPERSDIDPGDIRRILGDTFIVACDEKAGYPFRLAGTRMCAMFGRELRAAPFIGLWEQYSASEIQDELAKLCKDGAGIVASVVAQTADDRDLTLEMLLLPLRSAHQPSGRVIGTLAPIDHPYWLGTIPLQSLTVDALRHIGSKSGTFRPSPPIPAAPNSRFRPSLVVHQGGRRD